MDTNKDIKPPEKNEGYIQKPEKKIPETTIKEMESIEIQKGKQKKAQKNRITRKLSRQRPNPSAGTNITSEPSQKTCNRSATPGRHLLPVSVDAAELSHHYFQFTILPKSGFRAAPPTSPPSISGCTNSSGAVAAFTDPPYWIRMASAVA